ncbi:MAG: GNAT family N-acetyltransferase [Parasphingorhabdus sp.]
MPNIRFVSAKLQDIAALHKLVESAYRGDSARKGWTHEADLLGGQRTDREALVEIVNDDDQIILLALDDTELIGCVQLSRVTDTVSYLGLLTVNPDMQAGGIGKKIIAAAERFVQESWHSNAMEMTVIGKRDDLIAYYERRGFRRTGETRPFPMDDPRFGLPKANDLEFIVLRKPL